MPSERREWRVSRRRALTVGGAAATAVLAASGLPETGPSDPPPPFGGPFRRIHDLGITGDGVDVGVLDTTGFDPGHPAIRDAVDAVRSFGDTAVVDGTSHGTAAAAAVADLAPDVDLSLASFAGSSGFETAVEWLRERDVDVALAPVAAHGAVEGPASRVYRAAADAVRAGLTFVAPTGNAARGHWQGPFGALRDDRRPTRLHLRPPPERDGPSGRLVAWLVRHDGPPIDLTLALLELTETGDGQNLIALSQPSGGRRGEKLVADVDSGRYVLVVRTGGRDGFSPALADAEVEVVVPTHRLDPARPAGSVTVPAAAPGVLAVGAISAEGVPAYSGRGPTADGDLGVDLVAPPRPWIGDGLPGTSAAASRAAAAAALVVDAASEPGPDVVVDALRKSTGDVGSDGPDAVAGWGRLAPLAAVQRVRTG